MVLSHLNELEEMPYITRKIWMFTFQCKLNSIKIFFLAPVMTKIVVNVKISKFKSTYFNLFVMSECLPIGHS